MRILGREISLSQSLIKAVGELPAFGFRKPAPKPQNAPVEDRIVASDPLGDWYLALPDKLSPTQVSMILRAALAGNIWQQTQLTQRMRDSWPMFAKCCHELRDAVSRVTYVVRAHCEEGEEPTDEAQAKADVVRLAQKGFKLDRFADEDAFSGMVYDWSDALLNGISITQTMWYKQPSGDKGFFWLPRASAWVHPRHYSIGQDGRMGVAFDGRYDPLLFQNPAGATLLDDRYAFCVAKFKSKSGSPLGAGFMRPLAFYWIMVAYGREFALSFAQKYGGPFLDIPYKPGIGQNVIDRLEEIAKKALNMNYAVHPTDGEIKVTPAQSMGGDNPQVQIMRLADEACQLLLLGQTLTTSAPVNGGTRAQGEVHASVRREKLEGFAAWIGEILTTQWAASIVEANFGNTDECPQIVPDFTEIEEPMEAANRWAVILRNGIPVLAEEAYAGMGIKMPEEGDKVIIGQEIGTLTNTTGELSGQFEPQEGDEMGQQMARATDAELAELKTLIVKARQAPHQNGELAAVKAKVHEISSRCRSERNRIGRRP